MGKFVHRLKDELTLSKNVKKQGNGYLVCDAAVVAQAGVMEYADYEMPHSLLEALDFPLSVKVFRGLDVLTDNMDKYDSLPLTDGHWYEPVTVKDNSRTGGLFTNQKKTKKGVKGRLTVFDSNMIFDIESDEKRELSLGYDSELKIEAGVYEGQAYDVVLTSITPNHVALTRAGRCGPECSIGDVALHDSKGCGCDNCNRKISNTKTEGSEDMTDKLKAIAIGDSVVHVSKDDDSEKTIKGLVKRLADSEEKAEALQGTLDTTTAELDDHKTKFSDEAVAALVQTGVTERVAVLAKAKAFYQDEAAHAELDKMSNCDVMRKVLTDSKRDVEGKSEVYVQAAFDTLEAPKTEDTSNKGNGNGKGAGAAFADSASGNSGDDEDPVTAARNKLMQDNAKARD